MTQSELGPDGPPGTEAPRNISLRKWMLSASVGGDREGRVKKIRPVNFTVVKTLLSFSLSTNKN